MAKITALNRQKGALKTQVTKLGLFFEDKEWTFSKIELDIKLKALKRIQESASELRSQYYQLIEKDEDLPPIEKDLDELELKTEELEVRIYTFLSTHEENNSTNESKNNALVRLPELSISKFAGKIEEWNNFKMQFNSIINSNNQLSDVHKLQYLQSCLVGEAKHLMSAEDTYDSLFKALEERYENERIIVETHVNSILKYSKIQQQSTKELRHLIDTINKNIRALQVLKYERNYLSDILLINIILEKLDIESRKQFELNASSKEVPKLEELLSFLEKRCQVLDNVSRNVYHKTSKNVSEQKFNSKSLMINSDKNLCILCSSPDHAIFKCITAYCTKSERLRNPHLQSLDTIEKLQFPDNAPDNGSPAVQDVRTFAGYTPSAERNVILSTALVSVLDASGNPVIGRALLDCGSQSSFTTAAFADLLNLRKERITDVIPSYVISTKNMTLPPGVILADPGFGTPNKIDLLIGAELFWEIIKTGQFRTPSPDLRFQETVFGYIATGTSTSASEFKFCGFVKGLDSLEQSIQKFWNIENVEDDKRIISDEAKFCEEYFTSTYNRDNDGRFIVSMPLKEEPSCLGDSRTNAERRLESLWKQLKNKPTMMQLYQNFMQEYEDLNHMEVISDEDIKEKSYYLPHHGVYKPENQTTPLRVVFNASAATTSGKSLNDILLKGDVREDIFDIMVRFRKHKYAFIADIKKMYRQIGIHPSQQNLQRILWKKTAEDPVLTFKLKTVTYGTSSAPYLAIRTLQQLAYDEASKFPLASAVTLSDFYMDDVVSGASTIKEFEEVQKQLLEMFKTSGMFFHKWSSNVSNSIFNSAGENHSFDEKSENEKKALGINWNPTEDKFSFKVSLKPRISYTKRDVLSDIAKLYDPLGLIGPIICKAKIFMQRLWLLRLKWEDKLPDSIATEWRNFVISLKEIENIKVQRYLENEDGDTLKLHGFADASEAAYGATIYLQSISESHEVSSHLICSKSRVAPLKKMSIARLELSACHLLAELTQKTLKSLKMNIKEVILWSDSTIALAWIKTPSHQLKTYVGNRVSTIQQITEAYHWKHVASEQNPSDLISRGASSSQLSSLWFKGPEFLQQDMSEEKMTETSTNYLDSNTYEIELKKNICLTLTKDTSFIETVLNISNSFSTIIRTLCFIFRFAKGRSSSKGQISIQELEQSTKFLIKSVQEVEFTEEIELLKKNESVARKSKLKFLNPFLDKDSILRVGGRLNNSNLNFDHKHPIILPKSHKLTSIIFEYFHKKYLHLGPQSLLHHVRMQYWPINGKSTARKIVHECITCFKNKPVTAQQIMGNLPSERTNPNFTFNVAGVDFCGPFEIKYKNQRKGIYSKIYLALFICLATKAIHIELVTELTSEAFIAALKRFFARRGKSSTIMSDNAANFKGADSELKRWLSLVTKQNSSFSNYLTSESVIWKFIPPNSPNFGGLWEAGVKSVKYHLKRNLNNVRLTIEEFLTIVIQIEGILNSRPLTPLPSDSNEYEVLTPDHFLIGRPINAIPEPQLIDTNENHLSRWQKLTRYSQLIWKSWQRDYLNHLQNRTKWCFKQGNIPIGTMVLLKDDNLPPGKWTLGRIIQTTPGSDGNIRVVKVKTSSNIYTRGISKICVLPGQKEC
ncbi:uncharacterized protein LOC129216539 [Uloborus diversus]|uniref:uncharacterized protein LOC129216539 n=1 Tax=Uloborus diversus TaxID=327109 RepID=UPI002409BEF3|nr:uncharacterized protein LOC129216539 [Uloborus diversus]